MSENFGISGLSAEAAERAKRSFEETRENSIEKLASFSSVKQDEDGHYSWMGIKVPNELAGTLQYAASVLPNYVNNFLREGVYDAATSFLPKFNKQFNIKTTEAATRKFGLGAAATVAGALIAAQPISEVVHSVRQRSKDRSRIRQAISAIIETNKGYKDNEVIKTAMEHANKTMVYGFKHAASEFPTVMLNGYYARESHRELVKDVEYKSRFSNASGSGSNDDFKGMMSEKLKQRKADKRVLKRLEKQYPNEDLNQLYKEHLEDQKARAHSDYESRSDKPKNTDETNKLLAINLAGGANVFIKSMVAKSREADNKNPSAYERIIDLQEKINNGNIPKGSDIRQEIAEIFQQNEVDRGRPTIGPALMEKFNPLIERIAEVISNRELDAISLVTLVGDGKIVNKRRFVNDEKLNEIIDSQRKVFSLQEKTPLDEFLADFQNPKMVMQSIKETMKSLDGDAKAVFISMLPTEAVIAAGVKKKEIPSWITRGHDYMAEFVKTQTVELAKKTPEELKAKGLSEKNIEAINNLNELINEGNEKGIKSAIASTDNSVVSAVRTAGLNSQLHGDKMYWTKVITPKKQTIIKEKPADTTMVEAIKAKSAGHENGASLNA